MTSLHCLLLLLAASVLALPAAGQEVAPERFYPLEQGDTWVFGFSERECPNHPGECDSPVSGLVTRTVVGTVEVEGQARPLVRAEVRGAVNAEPGCVADYAVWLDPATTETRIEPQGDSCPYAYREDPIKGSDILEAGADLDEGFQEELEIMIGGISYTVLVKSYGVDVGFSNGVLDLGLDIGLVRFSAASSLGGSSSTYTSYSLQYAEVGGTVYGTMPTAGEGGAAPSAFALGAAYPNPSRSATTLALSLPTAGAATVAVFDVLGRRVLERDLGVRPAGTQPVRLDLGAVPPGVYFARATTAAGQTATRRIVRVD